MEKSNSDIFFEKPFIKEYIFNLQMNEKIGLKEFVFTKKSFFLFGVVIALMLYYSDSNNALKYISIGGALVFLFLFKNTRILKREKYEVPQENARNKSSEFPFQSFYSKTVKKVLSQKHYVFLLLISIPQVGYSQFANDIDKSTSTQEANNKIHKEENIAMSESAKTKHIQYHSQEHKFHLIKELDTHIKSETDLKLNKVRIILEKSKNEITK